MFIVMSVLMHGSFAFAETTIRLETTKRIIYDIYRPAYRRFAEQSQQLSTQIENLCTSKTSNQISTVRSAFSTTVAAFSAIEFYRIGPMIEDNRQNRLFYWPDSRRAGERQLRALLANSTKFNAETVGSKSVALQGFPALERLLFDKAAKTELTAVAGNNRCAVATTVAGNIANVATQLLTEWSDSSELTQQLLHPSETSDHFRTELEVLRSYITQLSAGLEFLITRKLEPLIAHLDVNQNKSSYRPSIRKAPFWKSDNVLTNLEGNIVGLHALLIDSGIAFETNLENELNFEFTLAYSHIDKLKSLEALTSDSIILSTESQELLHTLLIPLASIQVTIGDRISKSLGVSAGFNSDDGD